MSEQKMVTEREARKREREAAEAGIRCFYNDDAVEDTAEMGEVYARAIANVRKRFPLPPAKTRFPELLVMNMEECQRFVPDADDVCISITSPQHGPAKLSDRFRAILRVAFDDWPWPGPLRSDAVQITDAIADEIVAFALTHRGAKRLVIHCHAGVSRSTSTAQALCVHIAGRWWFPRWFRAEYRRERAVVNPEVFNAIANAYGRACSSADRVVLAKLRGERQHAALLDCADA